MGLSGHAPGGAVIGVSTGTSAISAIVVAARMYARLGIARNAGLDDLFICLALVFSFATTATMVAQVHFGMSRHQDTIAPSEEISQAKAFYISIWVYNLTLSCAKISILLQYLRIFPQKKFRICCYTLLGIVVVYSFYTFFTAVFACTPIAYFWDPRIPGGHCLDRFRIWFANAGINIGTDILTAVLPIPVLKQLELPSRQRKALMAVFGLAGLTCIISVLRMQSLYVVSHSTDISWHNPAGAIWSIAEANIAIMCSCLPTLRCMFPRIFKSTIGASRDTGRVSHRPTTRSSSSRKKLPTVTISKLGSVFSSTSKSSSSAARSYDTGKSETSLDAFERAVNPSSRRTKSQCVRAGVRSCHDDDGDIELGHARHHRGRVLSNGGIHVNTAIEQTVEKRAASCDGDSTNGLVKGSLGWYDRV